MTRADGSLSPRSVKKPKRSRASRQVDYAVAIALNAALLFVINAWPTWRALPFVTVDAVQAVTILNFSAIVAIVLNMLCLAVDIGWLKPLAEFINAIFAFIFSMEVWRSFPFEFPVSSVDWALITRLVIIAAIVGSVIGIIVQLVLVIMRLVGSIIPQPSAPPDEAN